MWDETGFYDGWFSDSDDDLDHPAWVFDEESDSMVPGKWYHKWRVKSRERET